MNYWLDLFTGTTWREFRDAGAKISGFRARQSAIAKRVQPGDIFLCYLTGVMRWVGALEIQDPTSDMKQIWKEEEFPVRFAVKPLVTLEPELGVPMEDLEGQVKFYATSKDKGKFKGIVRSSLNAIYQKDGELILSLLRKADQTPVSRPVDPKKLARKAALYKVEAKKGKGKQATLVSVPEPEVAPVSLAPETQESTETATTRHAEIQYQLLTLGAELGLDVWVARNDRSRKWSGSALGSLPRMLDELPTQFNEATTRTIELIDVLRHKPVSRCAR